MPFFQYRATDPAGRPSEGTISAVSADAARDALTRGGYRVAAIQPAGGSPAVATVAPKARPLTPPRTAAAQAPQVVVAPAPKADIPTHKTPRGRYRDLYFLFGQVSSILGAGVNPAQMFHTLSSRVPGRYTQSLADMASGTGESLRISQIMERYPYLYPPNAVGMMKAGETAGFVPQAAERISNQNYSIHRLHRRLGWLLGYFCFLLFAAQGIYGVVVGALASIQEQNKADGRLPVVETLLKHLRPAFFQNLPIALGWVGLVLLLYWGWNTMPLRMVRHRMGLMVPILSARARSEAIATFSWAAGLISTAGLSAQSAYLLAAESIPNLVLREQMLAAGRTMAENERMSSAIVRTGVMPREFGHVIETGELTGTVPDALGQIARNAEAEFEAKDKIAATAMTAFTMVLMAGIMIVILATLYRTYATGLINMMTEDPT